MIEKAAARRSTTVSRVTDSQIRCKYFLDRIAGNMDISFTRIVD
ncbi:hypothetical protein [Cohnella rhizosphaerae]|uniref:Uncharacterized protein n=1 Tax=Cohnella rhizosphaerae TaxID=1457232 RepID=A0A9X4QVG1_9BACL|nr:hypothetical protein [Cohnella rhizosphaerae]MDG0813296.1 hypothetical protein [Cohnella rhizosphaerae]